MPKCDHCLLEFPEREAIRDNIDGHDKTFCCHGCQGIYTLIHSEGLDDFYEKRRGWLPGPAGEPHGIDASAFAGDVRDKGGGILEIDITIEGIRCASCVWLNEKILERTSGVVSAHVNYATHRARLVWRTEEVSLATLLNRVAGVGYTPKPYRADETEENRRREQRDLLIRFGTAGFFSMQLMIYSFAIYAGYFQGMEPGLLNFFHFLAGAAATPVVFYGGWPFIRGGFRGLLHMNFNMDVLVAAGALSAYFYSIYQIAAGGEVFFDTAAMIVTFVLLGRYIETSAKGRASEALVRLMNLSPREARRINPATGAIETVPLKDIVIGDIVEVMPGTRIPLDGIVTEGSGEVDESMLTGESKALHKAPGAEVFGGTLNQLGSLRFRVLRPESESVLASIVRAVEDAQTRRAPVQAFADRVVGVFVPAVILLALGVIAYRLMNGSSATEAAMNAVSVLVIACPCALGLATPLAIVVATTSGASRGILIKGGDVIERAGRIDTIVLDKTGTVTEGKPALILYKGLGGTADEEALRAAASLEARSEHSLGRAIERAGQGLGLYEVASFSAHPGRGISGTLILQPDGDDGPLSHKDAVPDGHASSSGAGDTESSPTNKGASGHAMEAFIGNEAMMAERSVESGPEIINEARALEASGATVVFLCIEGRLSGLFAISDAPRPDAALAVERLKGMGLEVLMVTGDNALAAQHIGQAVGISEIRSGVTPSGKADIVRALMRSTTKKGVAMAGDGINDAPALVEADLGIAVGRATDVALESAEIVLMRPGLTLLPDGLALAKKTYRIIRQNIAWAFMYNIIAIPLAIAGVLHPIVAAGAMALSSISVVVNSMRGASGPRATRPSK